MNEEDIEQLDSFFEQLLATDLFTPLSSHEAEALYASFKVQTSRMTVQHFMFGMSGIIYLFDSAFWQIRSIEQSYFTLLQELMQITRGSFEITAVLFQMPGDEGEAPATLEFSYQINGQRFQHRLNVLGNMVDLHLVRFINEDLACCGVNGRFYWVETDDQVIAITFLSDEQYAIIKPRYNEHIHPFEDYL